MIPTDPFSATMGAGSSLHGGDAGPSESFSDATQTADTNVDFGPMVVGGSASSFGIVAMVGLALVVFAWLAKNNK
nr:hypothetical protein 9 [Moraxellaceae bacterium]